jgi:hypothetical protein
MRCYRVDEDAIVGIHLSETETGGFCIEVGDARVALDSRLSSGLLAARYRVSSRLRECLSRGMYKDRSLSQEELRRIRKLVMTVEKESPALLRADLSRSGVVIREHERSDDALVLVETTEQKGRVKFKSSAFTEWVDEKTKRVRRTYDSMFPPQGVTIVCKGKMPQGSNAYLLRMIPSASFRIERRGDLQGIPHTLIVTWRGKREHGHPALSMVALSQRLS